MNKEIKERWLGALRSGSYAQTRLCLRNHDGEHCCLGVLCDLVDPEGWDRRLHRGETSLPCVDVRNKVEINRDTCNELSLMNDRLDDPLSFEEIADWIEENL